MNHAYEGRIPTQKLTAMAAITFSNNQSITWILESSASNNITYDLTNMVVHNEYQGKDHVVVGNGAGLAIGHTSSSKITCSSLTFALKNILHCPSIVAHIYQYINSHGIITITYFFILIVFM